MLKKERNKYSWLITSPLRFLIILSLLISLLSVSSLALNWSNNLTFPSTGSTYSPSQTYMFNVSWTNINFSAIVIENNFTGSLANNSMINGTVQFYYNSSPLAAGTYVWKSYANDTNGLTNSTDQWEYVVNQASTTTNLTLNGAEQNVTLYYPQNVTPVAWTSIFGATLYRNGTDVNGTENGISVILGAGFYNYTAVNPGNVNYSASSKSFFVTVYQNVTTCYLAFNPVSSITFGTAVNATCHCNSPDAAAVLYRNGTDVSATENNTLTTLGAANYNYTCNVTSSANYTAATNSSLFIINPAPTALTLTATSWTSDFGTSVTYNCTANNTEVNATLYRNGTYVVSPYTAALTAGNYNFTCNNSATQNYSSGTPASNISIVSQGSTTTNLTLDGSEANLTVTYPQNFTPIFRSSPLNATLYRNGTDKGSDNTTAVLLGVGFYNYTAANPGNANYTGSSKNFFVTVSQNTSALTLTADSWSVTTGTATTVNCSAGSAQINATLYRDGVYLNGTNETATLAVGSYNYTCNSSNTQNYSAMITSQTLTVSAATTTTNGGGGGGGGGYMYNPVTLEDVLNFPKMTTGDQVQVYVGEEKHTIQAYSFMTGMKVNFKIDSPDSTFVYVDKGETKNLDLDKDGTDDVSIKVNDVFSYYADVVIKMTSALPVQVLPPAVEEPEEEAAPEEAPTEEPTGEPEPAPAEEPAEEVKKEYDIWMIIMYVAIGLLIIAVIISVLPKKKHKMR